MKSVLAIGYFGFGNFGDEVLLHVLVKDLIKAGFEKSLISAISNNPDSTSKSHNINSINRWNFFEVAQAIISNDVLIFIGGLFQDKTSLKSFYYYYLILFFANFFNKDVVFYGAGIGPVIDGTAKSLLKKELGKVKYITVRDSASASYTNKDSFSITTIDPAWSVKINEKPTDKVKNINWQEPVFAVCLRNDKTLKQSHLKIFAEKFSRMLLQMKEWQILFIPCMPAQDLSVTYELYELVANKSGENKVFILEDFENLNIEDQISIIGGCDLLFGMRYHALLICTSNESPVFGIKIDDKIKSLIEFSGQVGYSLNDDFEQTWNYFWQNISHSSNIAKEKKKKALELHEENFEMLKAINE